MKSGDITKRKSEKGHSEKRPNSGVRATISAILILIIIVCCVILAVYYAGTYKSEKEYSDLLIGAQTDIEENPIDFSALTESNSEIYAWIQIEDTNIDYPIVQSANDDEFYLKHSAANQSYSASGAIYTEMVNSTDFSDPVTLIYGHNGYGSTMFTTLHYFEDEDFFNEHEYFTIYLDGRKLTYQIISAFEYDDRHIMNSFDFSDSAMLLSFQQMLQSPEATVKNVRQELDVELGEDSKIVILSTCISGKEDYRYLVSAVLVKDEVTV
ncbi:MAG: class B sortase [Clostridiales bacterium]|nr:class B sortase [Clostridiales bacterium]